MRYYRGIRFDIQSDLDYGVKYILQELDEAKGAAIEKSDLAKRYYRSYPEDTGKLEASKLLAQAAQKMEQARLLVIQAKTKIK